MQKRLLIVSLLPLFVACSSTPEENQVKEDQPKEVKLKDTVQPEPAISSEIKETESVSKNETKSKAKTIKNSPQDDRYLVVNLRDLNKELAAKQDSAVVNRQQMPEKWVKQYDRDKKWQEMYATSVASFLKGWENEFTEHPASHIPKDELIFAYRKRMEKLFFDTPSFIEYSTKKFTESKELSEFLKKWAGNIN